MPKKMPEVAYKYHIKRYNMQEQYKDLIRSVQFFCIRFFHVELQSLLAGKLLACTSAMKLVTIHKLAFLNLRLPPVALWILKWPDIQDSKDY